MSIVAQESALVAHLEAALKVAPVANAAPAPGKVLAVYSQVEYTNVAEQAMLTPSLAVIFAGYSPGSAMPGNSAIQQVVFNWLVVVNVRNARSPQSGQGVRDDASPLWDAVMEACLGFRMTPKHAPLKLEGAPGAAITDAGFGYYPLAFSTTSTYRGTTTN